MKRREFGLKLLQGVALTSIPFASSASGNNSLKFAVIADVHKDLIPDADMRLRSFIAAAKREEVDFIIQLGDFCFGKKENRDFMSIWESFDGPRYHVLGNHDMDMDTKPEVMSFWGMKDPFYSFDSDGYHFVVLDANFLNRDGKYQDYANANFYVDDQYRTFVHPEQIEWLQEDLARTKLNTIVFSHQSLWHPEWGVKNRSDIQSVLGDHQDKIVCCMNGHNHIDYQIKERGINYVELNSASYSWMNKKMDVDERFDEETQAKYPMLKNMAIYEDPLFAIVNLDGDKGEMTMTGINSQWWKVSPQDLGIPLAEEGSRRSPNISDLRLLIDN